MVLESLIACRVNAPAMSQPVRTAWTIYAAFCTTMLHISVGLAQTVAPITPSGLDTQVNLSTVQTSGKVQYDITGGTRAGTNLFHSFGDFDAPNNSIANFLNDSGLTTSNILGRVTGGNSSTILGTIQTTDFGNANLFLMNPAGIVFGPTATLNVGGSVTFTTADYLRLGNAGGPNMGIFYADPALGIAWPFIVQRNVRFLVDRLSLEGAIDIDRIQQSMAALPSRGEGLADAFDIGGW